MGEKRGNTGKLIYDFNTAGVMEVFLKDIWRRTTCREFRSFDGKRRISEPTMIEHGKVDMPMRTYEYDGAVYVYDTNMEVNKSGSGKMVTGEVWDEARKQTEKRGV
tara:strand:+ start:960 stop:1277 length:318 start_codon:yes stop_codon:yes gene_type:complete